MDTKLCNLFLTFVNGFDKDCIKLTPMNDAARSILHYLPVSPHDEEWGIVCTTTGHQRVPPGSAYPVSRHPDNYLFVKGCGRTLTEYQLVYITEGKGRFESASCPATEVGAGTMLLLFPGEWHSYSPDVRTGWTEWWVGFRGVNIDKLVENGFLPRQRPLLTIGRSDGIERCYREIIATVEEERVGFQPLISSIVLHILASALFKHSNLLYTDNPVVAKINRARAIMRADFGRTATPEQIAREVGMGYTWFRRAFREYAGMAPAQYQQTMRLNKARELLTATTRTISEIAYELGFESVSAFSLFFRSRERTSPSQYRARYRG